MLDKLARSSSAQAYQGLQANVQKAFSPLVPSASDDCELELFLLGLELQTFVSRLLRGGEPTIEHLAHVFWNMVSINVT